MPISLSVPEDLDFKPRITVVGVGGGGCNAVDHMIESKLEGVSFVACNTDLQALRRSTCPVRVRLGLDSTQGLGAGSNPVIGREAAEESLDEVMDAIGDTHMLFIVAGFGGGTGTGAVPVIARAAHERGILTVAVVTTPFTFEAVNRTEVAQAGLQDLRNAIDTFVVIANQKLFDVQTDGMSLLDSFRLVDNVLYDGVRGITDLLMCPGLINLDFADVRSAMKDAGAALMGTGEATGEDRIEEATNAAISNPLLSYQGLEMDQATNLLVNITSSANVSLTQTERIMEIIRGRTHERVNLKVGVAIDDNMGDTIRVSVVMAGLDREHGSGLEASPPRILGHPEKSSKPSKSEPHDGEEAPARQGRLEVPGVFGHPSAHSDGPGSRQTFNDAAGSRADSNGLDPAGPSVTPCSESVGDGFGGGETMEQRSTDHGGSVTQAADRGRDGQRAAGVAGSETGVSRAEPSTASMGNGVGQRAAEVAELEPDRPRSARRARKPHSEQGGGLDGSLAEPNQPAPRVAGRDEPIQDSLPGNGQRAAVGRERMHTTQDPESNGLGLGSTPASDRMAGATVARGSVATPQLRPAVHFDSETGQASSSWTKLFGFLPVRRKSGKGRQEPSLQLHAPGAREPASSNARSPVSNVTSGRDSSVGSGPSWAGRETVSARAVLGIDPRQIPSFRK
ncbi:MAG: cell division protein FtsZ [Rhodospirillales bacterium]|nr:cell division protein FtsZ [Rhodospirillales bacterium]